MQYLIAVLPDRIGAEAAYTALEDAGFDRSKIDIVGRGYRSADEVGLANPDVAARRQISLLNYWLVPFGFGAGFLFNILSGIDIFVPGPDLLDHVVGGVLGAGAGLLGSYFTGGWVGSASTGDALTYRNRLEAGRYLVILRGEPAVLERAVPILRRFRPEHLQGYVASDSGAAVG